MGEAITKRDYVKMGQLIHMFTYHVNLLILYDPNGVADSIHWRAVNNIMR